MTSTDKNPVMLLNELRPGLIYAVTESGESPVTKRFIQTVTVDELTFEGSGASKKLAKQAAARAALSKLYNMTFTPHMQSLVGGAGLELGAAGAAARAGAVTGADGMLDELVPGE